MTTTSFESITPAQPDLPELTSRMTELTEQVRGATDVAACLEAQAQWDALRKGYESWYSLVGLRFNQDTTDAERKAVRERRDELDPKRKELDVALMRAFLDHPLRKQLEAEIGPQAFALWEVEVLAFDPAIVDSLVAESKLESEYIELLAGAELPFRGETCNLSTIVKFRQDADRTTRREAEGVVWDWYGANGEALDRIYGDLTKLRTEMAKKLGFDSFIDLGYKRMSRIDYDQADVERFRKEVRDHVVPLAEAICRKQAERLGVDRLMAWDEHVMDPSGNPAPKGDHDWMLERAQEMFDEMGSGLGEFFRLMNEGGFLDLRARKGKAGGGFCTSFPSFGMPFVYANFNGTKGDVEVFTHEIGHAFQCFSSREKPSDYLWPTMESCEIHSMSLEFLCWPHMEKFFGDDAERFRNVHLSEGLVFLPYGTAVDHFQHLVYENPGASAAERHGMWQEIERTYLPWRQWGDLDYPAKGGRWQSQRHIYLMPFYYIDYVLAQTCALQFWVRAEEDRAEAMRAYVALCQRGGEAPFQALARSAGLTSPFDAGCLAGVAEHARGVLGV